MKIYKKQYFFREIIFMILAMGAGTLFHFLYDWSGCHPLAALFAPVNESTWEHLKMLFFPVLLLSVPEYFWCARKAEGFLSSRTVGIYCGLAFIVIFYYTYTGIMGTHYLWLDIADFLLGVFITYFVTYLCFTRKKTGSHRLDFICTCLLLVTAVLFFCFTWNPPVINLFKNPGSAESV